MPLSAYASTSEAMPIPVKHVYIEEGVENVVITAKRIDFKDESGDFKKGRVQYGFLWAGIVLGMAAYFETRR